MSAKPSKPRAARRSKSEQVADVVAEAVVAEAVPVVPWVKPVRVLPDLAVRLARHWHFGWLTALLPRLSVEEARAALRAAGPGAVLPAALLAALRSQAKPRPSRPALGLADAEALAAAGDLPGAVRVAQRAVQTRADDPAALVQVARLLRRAGMDGPAKAALQVAVLRDGQGVLLTEWLGAGPEVAPVETGEVAAVAAAPVRRRKARS